MRGLKSLVLGAKVFGLCTHLDLRGLPCLETIVFGKECYKNSKIFCACGRFIIVVIDCRIEEFEKCDIW